MTQKTRGEVIFTGLGGAGVLLAGELLIRAATGTYKNVVFFPNYGGAVRGGPSECTAIFSDMEIASPVLSRVQIVVILEPSQLKQFEGRVRPEGTIIIESKGLQEKVGRGDITVIEVPALETARSLGNPLSSNLILLGAYIGLTELILPQSIESELEEKFGHNAEILSVNRKAFRKGLEIVKHGSSKQ